MHIHVMKGSLQGSRGRRHGGKEERKEKAKEKSERMTEKEPQALEILTKAINLQSFMVAAV